MRYHPLPESYCKQFLPTLPPESQVILFCLVGHSGKDKETGKQFKRSWPSYSTIGAETGINSETTIRRHIKILSGCEVLVKKQKRKWLPTVKVHYVQTQKRLYNGKWFMAYRNEYEFLFDAWLELDSQNGVYSPEEDMAKLNHRIDKIQFDTSRLSSELKDLLGIMDFVETVNGFHYFKPKPYISISDTEWMRRKFQCSSEKIRLVG